MGTQRLKEQEKKTTPGGPAECLGLTFDSEEARRAYFREILREKLQDPEFRRIEGFPIGSDEDILTLSDPPYYTACPNPFLEDFIRLYGTPYDPTIPYNREPFAADVSEGKNDPIYNAHSYHTKVPHKAIMRYILHYTEPGDIVFDGFAGTGMTGVAAQMCGDRKAVESLGYVVQEDGTILKEEEENGRKVWKPFSKMGVRRAILNDLSPAATFIAYNYNTPVDPDAFEREANRILAEVEKECGWMYETQHVVDGQVQRDAAGNPIMGKINYTVWSDVFVCPECAGEVIFWNEAIDHKSGQARDEFPCPHCGVILTKRRMQRVWVTRFDKAIRETVRQAKQVPVLINYSVGKKRSEKAPDEFDFALLERIDRSDIPYSLPTNSLPMGYNTKQPMESHGLTNVHDFYTKRSLWVLGAFFKRCKGSKSAYALIQMFVGSLRILSKHAKHNKERRTTNDGLGWVNAGVTGTLYVSSAPAEQSVLFYLKKRIQKYPSMVCAGGYNVISCQSTTRIDSVGDGGAVDYIFLDPPFGANIMYSELNFMWEAWLGVYTNGLLEAIENKNQGKSIDLYRALMLECFREAFRLLKPARWMTVEFSNTQAAVWNSIQSALQEAGFVVANVSALDKKIGSFKAVTTTTAVRQDLVISAYKPNGGLEERFAREAETQEGVWDFLRTHLKYLPVFKRKGQAAEFIAERDPRILFDRMVSYFVTHGYPVPVSSEEFQVGLTQRFVERDGMIFLPEQVPDYERQRMQVKNFDQIPLFVSDERSAIDWLRELLRKKPQTYQEIHPEFMKQMGAGWQKYEERPELSMLLEQNFLKYDGRGEVPGPIHGYLASNYKELRGLAKTDPALVAKARDRWYVPDPNRLADLEKLREKSLLRDFEEYRQSSQRRLKSFRLEAVRAGFKKAWQEKDYRTIVEVARKIPEQVLQEDPKLLMWYDQAVARAGEES